MSNILLTQTNELFENQEQWAAYLDLVGQKDNIKNLWFGKLSDRLDNYFRPNNVEDWAFEKRPDSKYIWYLEKFGQNSLAIWLEKEAFSLWVNASEFDCEKIIISLKNEYSELLTAMGRADKKFKELKEGGHYMITENGNFIFGSEYDGEYSEDSIAWYAGNRTEELANQIIEKVDRIRKDKHLTQLLREICEKTKRNP